jgi:pilus assembly protein CpaE
MVWVEADCSRYEFFLDLVTQSQPDIALISLDADENKALTLVSQVIADAPATNVLAVSSSTDGSLILRAIRAGAREFLTQPVKLEELLAALDRLHQTGHGDNAPDSRMVIAIAGAGGGVGATTMAINLGCCLARDENNSVVLIDLDLALGDTDACMDIIPDYTLVDVAQNVSRLDFTLLKRSLTKHSSGLFLLPRPIQIADAVGIGPDEINRVLGLLKATFTHLVLDISKSFSRLDLAALNMADSIVLVTQLDLPCLRNVVRLLLAFSAYEGLTEKVKIVINRVGQSQSQISLKKAQETIGREFFWRVPNDYATLAEARNNGVPVVEYAPRSKVAHVFNELATALANPEASESTPRKERSGLLRFLS